MSSRLRPGWQLRVQEEPHLRPIFLPACNCAVSHFHRMEKLCWEVAEDWV